MIFSFLVHTSYDSCFNHDGDIHGIVIYSHLSSLVDTYVFYYSEATAKKITTTQLAVIIASRIRGREILGLPSSS